MRGLLVGSALASTNGAHQQLQSLNHHLHLLAELSQPEHANPDHLILPHAGLAHCFTLLAEAAEQIVATTIFQPAP